MKKTGAYKIWQIIYPIGIYYVVSSVIYFFVTMFLGGEKQTYMLRQLICAAGTIPAILSFYRADRQIETVVYGADEQTRRQTIRNIVCSLGAGAMLGIAVNNVIAMTPLIKVSAGFGEANSSFFAGTVLYELLGSCLIIPFAEELLYRGVVWKRLRMLFGNLPALILSAVLFGVMHVNLVQFLYAGILGLLLAYLMQTTGKLYAPVLGHIAANVAAVVRQETGWLDFAYQPTAAGIGFSALLFAGAFLLLWHHAKRTERKEDNHAGK